MTEALEILLVEDSPFDAELTIRALSQKINNVGLNHVRDGEEAIEFLEAKGKYKDRELDNLPNLILLDIKLPKVNGMEFLRQIKNDKRTRSIPTIILTSSNEVSDIRTCYDLGANAYIVKPLDFDQYNEFIGLAGLFWIQVNQPFK